MCNFCWCFSHYYLFLIFWPYFWTVAEGSDQNFVGEGQVDSSSFRPMAKRLKTAAVDARDDQVICRTFFFCQLVFDTLKFNSHMIVGECSFCEIFMFIIYMPFRLCRLRSVILLMFQPSTKLPNVQELCSEHPESFASPRSDYFLRGSWVAMPYWSSKHNLLQVYTTRKKI